MSTLADIIVWPETLPLPLVDYNGKPMHQTLTSKLDSPRILRRSRYTAAVVSVNLQWVLDLVQYPLFKTFFLTTLGNGAAVFLLELKYPASATLNTWKVRFVSGFEASYSDGNWVIQSSIDLIGESVIPVIVPPTGYVDFLVVPDASPFVTADAFNYIVKE